MAKFLDLPPEVRAMIFRLLVISPTGCIEPITRYEGYRRKFPYSLSRIRPLFYLAINDLLEASNPLGCRRSTAIPKFVSISILSACRITYLEAHALFWSSTTFIFSSISVMRTVLRAMGKIATRRIRSIRLFTFVCGGIDFALQSLRLKLVTTSLQHLDIVLRREQIETIVKTGLFSHMGMPHLFFAGLDKASIGEVSKRLIVPGTKTFDAADERKLENAIRRIENDWGARIVWGDTLPCAGIGETAALL